MSSSGLCVLCQCKFDGEDRKSVILVCSHTMCSVCFKVKQFIILFRYIPLKIVFLFITFYRLSALKIL